jgi:two-component sensor histidine kinase
VWNASLGESRWYQTTKIPLMNKEGHRFVLGTSSDITERVEAEEKLRKSLKEKELLLQEIHHRVKNNLQIIISLLKLQSGYVFDERDKSLFAKSRDRVETMALIHEKLYRSTDLSNINIAGYVHDLTNQLSKAYGLTSSNIKITADVNSEINLSIDTAIPFGLIINELIANSIKYAFPDNMAGEIMIFITREADKMVLRVSDNGIGLTADVKSDGTKSFGLNLVHTLVKQLGGEIIVDSSSGGTNFTIYFKELFYKERI